MFEAKRSLTYLVGVVLVVSLAACGGTSPEPRPPGPSEVPPPPPPPVVVSQMTGVFLEAEVLGKALFTTSQAGSLEVTLDWTFPENDLDPIMVKGDCSHDDFLAQRCETIGFSSSDTAKPEVATGTAEAGTHTFFVANFGPGDETLSYQIVLTPNASASARPREVFEGVLKDQPAGFSMLH